MNKREQKKALKKTEADWWANQNRDFNIMKHTSDDWSPNYPGDQVSVVVLDLSMSLSVPRYTSPAIIRMAVWGADDCGMEKDIQVNSKEEADAVFAECVLDAQTLPEPLTKAYLRQQGFDWA